MSFLLDNYFRFNENVKVAPDNRKCIVEAICLKDNIRVEAVVRQHEHVARQK